MLRDAKGCSGMLSHQMDRRMALCFEDVVGAVPFTTMFALLVLWFGISVRQPGPPRNVAARCGCISYLPGISTAARFNICKTWSK